MLTLADASSYFDRTPILDADTGATLFYGQVDPYQDAIRDSATAYRRILSVKPGTAIPTKRAVRIFGSTWLVGVSELDGHASAHREKYVLHPAPSTLAVTSLSGYVSGAAPVNNFGDMIWLKDGKEDASSSRAVPMLTAYLSSTAALAEYDVVKVGSQGYLAMPPHLQASGVLSATCSRLEYAPVDATLSTRTYDPVQGKYTATVNTTVKCLRVRWQTLFLYGSQGDAKYQEGDCSLVLPAGTVLATKDTLTLSGQTWSILAVEGLGGAVVAHARRA
jgi:hypothetical protein